MDLKELASALKISHNWEVFETLYFETDLDNLSFCDTNHIQDLENQYQLFGDLLPAVLKGAREIAADPKLVVWGNLSCNYLLRTELTWEEASRIPLPERAGTAAGDMFMLLVLLSQVPPCVRRFQARGFSHGEICDMLGVFARCMRLLQTSTGRPGINRLYFGWCMNYILCKMFDYGSFNFELTHLSLPVILLRNKRTDEYAVLMTSGHFHRDGQLLGSAGYLDETDAFDAEFSETDIAYRGHASSLYGFVSNRLSVFSKDEWECAVKQGDPILSVHIPRNVLLTQDAIKESYLGGLNILKKRFPEHPAKYLYCYSWIIDTRIRELLGENSKIVRFGDTFTRFPVLCDGRDGFSFFFLGHCGTDNALPESTTLQRQIKKLYLSGGFTYSSAGFVTNIHL